MAPDNRDALVKMRWQFGSRIASAIHGMPHDSNSGKGLARASIAIAAAAVAMGAIAIGTLVIGSLAIRRLVISGAVIRSLEIERLIVGKQT